MRNYSVRKAKLADIDSISEFTRKNRSVMLFRSPATLKKLFTNYIVAVSSAGQVIGCCGFKTYPGGDAEIVSLAVNTKFQGRGIGDELLKTAIKNALERRSTKRILTLTTEAVAKLFRRNQFSDAGIQLFHEKILDDCRNCPRNRMKNGKYLCNEIALVYLGKSRA